MASQNAGMLQYRVPNAGEGFAFTITFIDNPDRKGTISQTTY